MLKFLQIMETATLNCKLKLIRLNKMMR